MYWMSREAGFVVVVYLWDSIRAQVLKLNNFKGGNFFSQLRSVHVNKSPAQRGAAWCFYVFLVRCREVLSLLLSIGGWNTREFIEFLRGKCCAAYRETQHRLALLDN